jgi:hypothetical protein
MSVGRFQLRVAILGSICIFEIVDASTVSYELTLKHNLHGVSSFSLQVSWDVKSLRVIDSFINDINSIYTESLNRPAFIVYE